MATQRRKSRRTCGDDPGRCGGSRRWWRLLCSARAMACDAWGVRALRSGVAKTAVPNGTLRKACKRVVIKVRHALSGAVRGGSHVLSGNGEREEKCKLKSPSEKCVARRVGLRRLVVLRAARRVLAELRR